MVRRPGKEILPSALQLFREAGFETSQPCDLEPSSFELAARRKEKLLLLKFLRDASEASEAASEEMRRISHHLTGSPLVVAERSGGAPMKPGVVYRRHGIPSVTLETLSDHLLGDLPPLAFAGPGGIYVRIDGPALSRARLARGLSLGDVAGHLGVSRRTVQKYEREGMAATVEKAVRLEELLGAGVVAPQDPLEPEPSPGPTPRPLSDRRLLKLRALGFEVHPTDRAPFDAVLQTEERGVLLEERTLLVGLGGPNAVTYRRARITASISTVARAASAFFVKGGEPPPRGEASDTVFLDEAELERAEDARDLLERIEEMRGG